MRKFAFVIMAFTAACCSDANHLGNPLLLPLNAVGAAFGNPAYNQTRGQVEIFVKINHPALAMDIQRGGGPTLTKAFVIAGVLQSIRAPHTLQLQSDIALYASNLDALAVAIMVVSG